MSQLLYLMKRSNSSEGTSQEILVGTWCKQYLLLCILANQPNPGLGAGSCTRQRDLHQGLVCCANNVLLSILVMGHVSMPSLFGDKICQMFDRTAVGFTRLLMTVARTTLYLSWPHLLKT